MLDALAAAMQTIKDAPVGFSSSVLGASLGPIKRVNPRDQALVKRIQKLVATIAAQPSAAGAVRSMIANHPDESVKNSLLPTLPNQ